jgi:hypothetical protein
MLMRSSGNPLRPCFSWSFQIHIQILGQDGRTVLDWLLRCLRETTNDPEISKTEIGLTVPRLFFRSSADSLVSRPRGGDYSHRNTDFSHRKPSMIISGRPAKAITNWSCMTRKIGNSWSVEGKSLWRWNFKERIENEIANNPFQRAFWMFPMRHNLLSKFRPLCATLFRRAR